MFQPPQSGQGSPLVQALSQRFHQPSPEEWQQQLAGFQQRFPRLYDWLSSAYQQFGQHLGQGGGFPGGGGENGGHIPVDFPGGGFHIPPDAGGFRRPGIPTGFPPDSGGFRRPGPVGPPSQQPDAGGAGGFGQSRAPVAGVGLGTEPYAPQPFPPRQPRPGAGYRPFQG